MTRLCHAMLLLTTLVTLGVDSRFAAAAKKPNILFIYTDDHSYRTVGCYP